MSDPPSHSKLVSAVLLLLALTLVVPAFSQTGVIQGSLVDPQGAVIVNAKVTAVDENKGVIARDTVTGSDGAFQLRPLRPGVYTVKAESPGMKPLERKGVVLDVNQTLNLGSLPMEVGGTAEVVTVEATTPQVETTTADKSFVISSTQVTEISLNGRDWQSLLRTLPGVVSNDDSDFRLAFNNTDSFHVNGMRGSYNNVFLDGTINTDVGANDGQFTQLSMDAVGEFKIQTSVYNAEYGRNPGILISAQTKSGTADFHGTLYEFVRNTDFNANDFFSNREGLPTPVMRFNQFGANLGGPLYLPKISTPHNKKLFFFFNYEGTRASRPVPFQNGTSFDAPSPAELQGDFSQATIGKPPMKNSAGNTLPWPQGTVFEPGTIKYDSGGAIVSGVPYPNNTVPARQFSQNAKGFQNLFNLVYKVGAFQPSPGNPGYVRIPFQDTYTFSKNQKALRVDYQLNSKTNAFFRWVDDGQQEAQKQGIFSWNAFPIFPEYRKKPGASWSWNVINTISPTLTNEAIFGYNHLTQVVNENGIAPNQYQASALGFTFQDLFPAANTIKRFPGFNCGSSCDMGIFPPNWVSEAKTYAWTDNLTKVAGAHAFKTGVFLYANRAGQQPAWTDAPFFDFTSSALNPGNTGNGVANMLLGNYSSVSQTNGRFFGDFKFWQLELYAQDSFRVSKKLNLEYGVRWAYLGPTGTHGPYLQYYFDPALYDPAKAVSIVTSGPLAGSISGANFANGMVQEGNGIPFGYIKHRWNNFAPRFGFAYDPMGNGKTSIRGGFGMFFERIRQNTNNFDGLGNPPLVYSPNIYGGQVDNLSPALVASGVRYPPGGVRSMAADGKIPTTYSWSLGVQRQLPGAVALDVAYVGNTVRHLQVWEDINTLPLGAANDGRLAAANYITDAIRPYLGYGGMNFTDFGGNSHYNALQAKLSRRFGKNFSMNADCTLSRVISDTDTDDTTATFGHNRNYDWGPAGYDRTHVFNFDYVYTLPQFKSRSQFYQKVLGGWELTGITRFWSGYPLTVTSNSNTGTLDGQNVRANYVGGDPYNVSGLPSSINGSPVLWWYNPTVFAQPATNSAGGIKNPKGFLRGPGINNFDVSLFKNVNFTERFRLQLRFESFNLFNHTQWTGVGTGNISPGTGAVVGVSSTGSTAGGAGVINGTRDPRCLQLGAKLYF